MLDWLGLFFWIEESLSTTTIVVASVVPVPRYGLHSSTDQYYEFHSTHDGSRVEGKCVRFCRDQLGMVVHGGVYFLSVSKTPLARARIIYISYRPDAF